MSNETHVQTGGQFLITPISEAKVFSREQFSEEHQDIEMMVKEFATDRILANKEDLEKLDKDLSLQLMKELGELGLVGLDVPEKYGGMEMDKITSAIVAEALSTGFCASFTATYSANTGIGTLPIVWFGTEEQKAKYLPKLVSGEWLGAYGLTEPSAGSDALSGKTKAILSEDGKHYILNGEKIFITNGSWAEVFTVFAQVDGTKFTAFIVERGTPGFEIGPEEKKMGMKGSSTTSLTFTDCKVPVENVLYKVGKGAKIAFNALNLGRFKLAAADLGGCKEVIITAVQYALERRQFGQPIAHFDAIRGKIADMIVRTYAADTMIYRTIGMVQDEINTLDKSDPEYHIHVGEAMEKFAIELSMTKVFGSESFFICTDTGIQVLGGYGFIEEYHIAGAFRDTRIDRIWEGTNEINRQIIAGYMMKKTLLEELGVRDATLNVDEFLATPPQQNDHHLAHEADAIETGKRLALYLFHEALCEFGQDLKHEQQLTEILADIFTDLYTAESVVVRAQQASKSGISEKTIENIAKVYTAEMIIRLLNKALTGLNGIYKGHLSENIIDHLRKFQARMLLKTDIIGLKRDIAEHAYLRKTYSY
ncbi:MAG: acyl-CoA dehydrogenase family protein [Candidatus Marinimicrobia bacterium]|nr:acyl-CoA dehydrogenase family protein [Candidatus Neomarinimicrobiota bacterium]